MLILNINFVSLKKIKKKDYKNIIKLINKLNKWDELIHEQYCYSCYTPTHIRLLTMVGDK